MFQRKLPHLSRPAWAAIAAIVLLVGLLAFPPVRAIASSFLGLFRVQQISVVPVNPENLPQQLGSSSQFESMLSQDVQIKKGGDTQKVASVSEANAQAGFFVRLPTQLEGQPSLAIQPGGQITFKVNVQHIQALLDEIGRKDIQLPTMLDGQTADVNIPTAVIAQYGDCQFDLDKVHQAGLNPDNQTAPRLPHCTTLLQVPSPTISAPPGLDVEAIGEAYLQVLGMSPEEAKHFAQNVDWTTTFVIPVPRYATTYHDVQVDGVTGSLIEQGAQGNADQYMLMWVKDGVVYVLTGPGNGDTAVAAGNSLQ